MDNEAQNHFIADAVRNSLGLAPDKTPPEFNQAGACLPRWHLLMLQDRRRLEYYSEIIKAKVKGKVVLDVGTGSGILSYLSLKWGAKKVYSVEENPALQEVYRHFMKEHLASGKAELICDDAQFLRLEQFLEGAPDIVVHELFGAFGMGENLIPIFRSLTQEGILTPKTQLVPDGMEVWMRPVWSEQVSKDGIVDSFEGYPLEELQIFGHQNFWEQDYLGSRASNWQSAGDSQLLFKCNLKDLTLPDSVIMNFKASKCSHIKLWMNILDTETGLMHSNDHQVLESHWANTFLTIPQWLRGTDFKVEFKIHPDKVEVFRFIKD
jgi:Ribosomal protein L11 methyltransferase (PrmA)